MYDDEYAKQWPEGGCPPLGDPELEAKVRRWVDWDKNPTTRQMIKMYATERNVLELEKCLLTRMEFGTAGLRGKMGPGYSCMNDLVLIQTTQGFVRYLEHVNLDGLKRGGVVIGYDGRHNSSRFAELATAAFVNQGYTVHLFGGICPTPFVPFAIRHFKCSAGIMVTASHNPKEDNGYKVYWENGAQIISPHDKGIQSCIMGNLRPWEGAWTISDDKAHLILNPLPEIMKIYYEQVADSSLQLDLNAASNLSFTYTAMHGVGFQFMTEAFLRAKFKPFHPVAEQIEPDPDFPTVRFPNPEEGKSALNLAIQTANTKGSSIILANDPDADRLAVAEKLKTGEWKIFNGNELGALLGWWALHSYLQNHDRESLSNCYMIASTVSSKILQTIATKEGFNFIETLTGFKWMGNRAVELIRSGKTVLFAFEEAIGFMCGTAVLDKDGIGAGIRIAELATHLMSQGGQTLNDKLTSIYEEYGFHLSSNSYYLCYEPPVMAKIFEEIRAFGHSSGEKGYPTELMNGAHKVTRVRDLTTGFDSGEPDKKATLPVSSTSQMITFTFDTGLVITLRTSGTEPKLKYYTELAASPKETDWSAVRVRLDEVVADMVNAWLNPSKWGLQAAPK